MLKFRLIIILVFCLTGCGLNEGARNTELEDYGDYLTQKVIDKLPGPRFIKLDKDLPSKVSKSLSEALTILNLPLEEKYSIKDRFRPYNALGVHDPAQSNGIIITVINYDKKGICADSLNPAYAELAHSQNGYELRLCYTKIISLQAIPSSSRSLGFECVLAHEIFHSDLYSHVSDITGCRLMCAKPTLCDISPQALNLWSKFVLPHISK